MTTNIPLRIEINTDKWWDGRDATFSAKLNPRVSRGSRGTVKRKRFAYGLLALAQVMSTEWTLLQMAGSSSLSPSDLEYGLRCTNPKAWRRFMKTRETRTWGGSANMFSTVRGTSIQRKAEAEVAGVRVKELFINTNKLHLTSEPVNSLWQILFLNYFWPYF